MKAAFPGFMASSESSRPGESRRTTYTRLHRIGGQQDLLHDMIYFMRILSLRPSSRGIVALALLASGAFVACSLPQGPEEAIEPRFAERSVMPFFQAAERTSPGALIDLIHPDFRTTIDNTPYDIGRFTELLRFDAENIENRAYRFTVQRAADQPDGRVRVEVEYSFRCRIKRSGEEWQTADRTATLFLLDDKLVGISGDRPFGMSDQLGVLYVRDGTVARNTPGSYSSIRQGTYQP